MPKDTKESVLLLFKGSRYTIIYAWRADEYVIENKTHRLIIDTGRISSFGVWLRGYKLSDELCDMLFEYIGEYEDVFNIKNRGLTKK